MLSILSYRPKTHDYRWGCDNSISHNLIKVCNGLSKTSLYRVVITPFIVMPDFNLKWVIGYMCLTKLNLIYEFQKTRLFGE
jgi:hypothetical protein